VRIMSESCLKEIILKIFPLGNEGGRTRKQRIDLFRFMLVQNVTNEAQSVTAPLNAALLYI
jgi:hypothetical protein